MSRCKPTLFAALLMLGGCASPLPTGDAPWIDPGQAVLRAAAAPYTGVTGVFALTVQATGRTDKVHLNSERDYRDPRNLSIAVMPRAAAELEARYGAPPEVALRGKQVQVVGTARRVRIDFSHDGKPTDKYYYQTHVRVTRAAQIQVL
ncbi:hypothetical protein WCE41_12440 [Luteimonas sp. MJ246]|uniref:hypothetical protein n=1 Tax=Luteimonas sp. MJ174 TaxID=3129237 RepID=UPI0031BB68B9